MKKSLVSLARAVTSLAALAILVLTVAQQLDEEGVSPINLAVAVALIATTLLVSHRLRGGKASTRWTQLPPVTYRAKQSMSLTQSPEAVWPALRLASNAALLDGDALTGSVLPETPTGVGEQRVTTYEDGTTVVDEVVELVDGERIRFRRVSPPPPVPWELGYQLDRTGDGSRLTLEVEFPITETISLKPDLDATMSETLTARLQQLRSALDKGDSPP
jgi:hypothetical protein